MSTVLSRLGHMSFTAGAGIGFAYNFRAVERAAGAGDMDAVVVLGALAWMGALLAGVAMIGDGPLGPVLTLGGVAAFILMADRDKPSRHAGAAYG